MQMNEFYSYSRPMDPLLGFDDVDKNYRVSHSMNTESTDTCPNCKKKLVAIERDLMLIIDTPILFLQK